MQEKSNKRTSGILLHITSLPSVYGIGGLGKEAFAFIDYLKNHGHTYWQILPLNYPGYGDSPYNAISSFAGNPYLIDPLKLNQLGLVSRQDLIKAELPNNGKINFRQMMKTKQTLFRLAYNSYIHINKTSVLIDYLDKEAYWLKPFIAFCYLKDKYKSSNRIKWGLKYQFYSDTLFNELYSEYKEELLYHAFLQYIGDMQLTDLKQYAVSKGIRIIGDVPLYVSLESSDVWSKPELFELDKTGKPLLVSGVPPDAFSETGQLWGNPIYNWHKMQADGFDWWKRRLRKALCFADRIRLDHFIGFVNYWAIDAKETSAVNGKWLPGPGYAFFDSVLGEFGRESFIAEDLGILTDEVNHLRDHYGFPGMIILQFCFADDHNDILSFPRDRIIYTGTHDNQTTLGWFKTNISNDKQDNTHMENYLHRVQMLPYDDKLTKKNVSSLMTELALKSPCHIAIIPLQDILALDDKARMNIPGTALGNWHWRLLDI